MVNKANTKNSFFDNIYYWFYRGFSRIRTDRGYTAEGSASLFVVVFQFFNGGFIFLLMCAITNANILNVITGGSKLLIISIACILMFFLMNRSDSYYKKRHDSIIDKFDKIDRNTKRKKRFVFFIYVLVSLGVFVFAPKLSEEYLSPSMEKSEKINQDTEKRNYNNSTTDIMQLLDSTKIMQYKDSVK